MTRTWMCTERHEELDDDNLAFEFWEYEWFLRGDGAEAEPCEPNVEGARPIKTGGVLSLAANRSDSVKLFYNVGDHYTMSLYPLYPQPGASAPSAETEPEVEPI